MALTEAHEASHDVGGWLTVARRVATVVVWVAFAAAAVVMTAYFVMISGGPN